MFSLKWESRFSVGVEAMDAQHQHLFNLLHELYDRIHQGRDAKGRELGDILVALFDYANTHFQDEERLMRRTFFRGLSNTSNSTESLLNGLLIK